MYFGQNVCGVALTYNLCASDNIVQSQSDFLIIKYTITPTCIPYKGDILKKLHYADFYPHGSSVNSLKINCLTKIKCKSFLNSSILQRLYH